MYIGEPKEEGLAFYIDNLRTTLPYKSLTNILIEKLFHHVFSHKTYDPTIIDPTIIDPNIIS